jgi:hypothetical protein
MKGRRIPLSPARRLVETFNDAANTTQKGVLGRRLTIPRLAALQSDPARRRAWPVVFAKAYALVAVKLPELRRAHVALPWPHLYEYPASVAVIVMSRELDGEQALFWVRVKEPEALALDAVEDVVRRAKAAPIHDIKDFRVHLRVAALPRFARRLLFAIGLNIGRQRANFMGTFGISSLASAGVDVVYGIHPLTALLSYGPLRPDGTLRAVLSFDHRTFDGGTVATALTRLEAVLEGPIADEIEGRAA